MKRTESLPEGYNEYYSIDLQKNKKISVLVNGLSVLIMVVMVISMNFLVPVSTFWNDETDFFVLAVKFISVFVSLLLYIVLHELVHGIAMKICGTKKVKYGFTGLYAFAGSEDYYSKGAYIFIALAPVVLWGVVLAVLKFIVPIEWFWVVYIVQISNIGGAAGDFFVTVKFSRFPKDILVKDHGVGMTVYSKE